VRLWERRAVGASMVDEVSVDREITIHR
jgi:hypothetical protein